MRHVRRIRRHLVRLFPPILLTLALSAPAHAQTGRHTPHPLDAHHCIDVASDHWLEQLPAPDLIIPEGAGAVGVVQGGTVTGQVFQNDRIYEQIWRQYVILPSTRKWQWRWMRAWEEDGHVGCTWRDSIVHTYPGNSPYNPHWLG
jgi:hypothetical protein